MSDCEPELVPAWLEPELDPDWPIELPELGVLPELLPVCATIVSANSRATANTNSEYFLITGFSFC